MMRLLSPFIAWRTRRSGTAAEAAVGPSRYWSVGAPLLIFAIFSAGIGAVGYAYFRHQLAASREAAQLTMSAVADLKVRQILKWREERLSDARVIMSESRFRRDLQSLLSDPTRGEANSDLLEWLKVVEEQNEGLRILLLDRRMNVRLAYPPDQTYFGPTAQSFARQALRENRVVMSDLHRSRFSGAIHLDLAIPVTCGAEPPRAGASPSELGGRGPLGVIDVEVDPEKFLYPQIRNWPTPSPSAETLLVRREGDQVEFLNELRHKKGTALSLRMPANDPWRIAAQALRGRQGVMEGVDYRGQPVLAAVRRVSGTPWLVVAKVDRDEIYAPLHERGALAAAFALVLVIAAGLGVGLLERRRDTHWLRSQLAIQQEHLAERKRAEGDLKKSEDRFRLLIEEARDVVFRITPLGIIEYCSPAVTAFGGYTAEEEIGQPLRKYFADAEQLPGALAAMAEAIQTGQARTLEVLFQPKTGEPFWIEVTGKPVVVDDQVVAINCIMRDASERKRAENLLRASEEQHRLLVQNSFSGIALHRMIFDAEGKPVDFVFLSANPAFERHMGICAEDVVGRRGTEVLRGIEKTPFIEMFGKVAATGQCITLEKYVAPLERYFFISAYRVAENQFATIFMDITERKRTEQALLESEKRLRSITDAAQDAILMMDARGAIAFWNPAAELMLGYRRAEALGMDLHQLLAPDRYLGAHRAALPEFLRTGQGNAIGKTLELAARRKDGQEIQVALSLSAVSVNGEWLAVGTLRDITERKRAEELQEQYTLALEGQKLALEQLYDAAEVANRTKSEFLANMSHEIRTPMTAILGYADVLAGQLDDPEQREAINIIRRNGDHLLMIINDILDLSKIEAGKLQFERRTCSPAAIVADVVSLMRVRADGKGLALKLEFAGPIPETIWTDPARLRQILLNLVGNAIKFTASGSVRIVVRLSGGETPQPRMVYEVIDTGIGMIAEQVENLFQPFQQADASTSRKFGGTGLGLAISKRLAEFLGGDIVIGSQPGQGSTFVLTFDPGPLAGVALLDHPSEAISASFAGHASERPQPRLSGRILLAEDGTDNQRFISFLLTKAGAQVTTVDNGRQAMEMALADPCAPASSPRAFDVILMDMQMPVMDGYEATRRLRAEGYAGPIIALTAHAMAEDRQKCLDAGCDDYATKPIDRDTLLSMIAKLLQEQGAALQQTGH
jgi:PAS domain S-box-containing protein